MHTALVILGASGEAGGADVTRMVTALAIFGATYVLIASEKVEKAVAAGLGAAAVILLHCIPYPKALEYVDLNVIFLLLGMMIIVNILARTGLFEWLATSIARAVRGNGVVILVMFLLITAVVSAVLDNVTTVILIAPITILTCQVLEIPAVPFLAMEAIFSNIGGTATLVGDPPNVLIGSQAGLTFNEFIIHLTPVVLLITGATVLVVVATQGKSMRVRDAARQRIMVTEPRLAIIDRRRMVLGLSVFGLVLIGFVLGHALDVQPGIVALAGALLMALVCRADLHQVLGKVEWGTILFFIGLFMLVGSLQENGVFLYLGKQVMNWTQGNLLMTTIVVLWISAIASAVVDNIPLVIAMIPLIQEIIPAYAAQMGIAGDPALVKTQVAYPLFWALALGACLGGNGTLVGASANVVISQIARKNKYDLSFWTFTKMGLPLMLLSLVFSTVYLWLRYFGFRG